ncbi:MAG: exodeoxyribonuclease VII large subunit [Candidatus Cloacimonas sp.]
MDNIIVYSVFEVTRQIRQVIESSIDPLYVMGEISNFVHHSSGHIYFNLKDENATLRCTFFKGANYNLNFRPENGMQVICYGKLTVFEKGGSYNLNILKMQESGLGLLQQKYEQLKKKLEAEGLFAAEHKKPIPKYPDRIGIVTSPTGAAMQDILNIIKRRYPVELIVYPALVQGSDAPKQIVSGIKYFNTAKNVDFIIITRGGGSQEDLFCFNDESIVRAIFDSELPIISAVGHEIDFTLADFVADLRAPTPSAAAELAVPDKKELLNLLNALKKRLDLAVQNKIDKKSKPLLELHINLEKYHPIKVWREYQQRFDMAEMALNNTLKIIPEKREKFDMRANAIMQQIRSRIDLSLSNARSNTILTWHQLNEKTINNITNKSYHLNKLNEILEQLSPQRIQSKGWIMAYKEGKLISSVQHIKKGDILNLGFVDGNVDSIVEKVEDKK